MEPASFEVLHTLGWPVYVRRVLLEEPKLQSTIPSQSAANKQPLAEPRRVEDVRQRAQEVTAKHSVLQTNKVQPVIKWPEFHLAMLAVSGHILVLCDIPTRSSVDDNAYSSLVARMIAKCGVPAGIDSQQEFHWPLFTKKTIDQSTEVAKKALASVLHKEQKQSQWKWLLLLGEKAVDCTLGQPFQAVVGQQGSYLGIPTIASQSVGAMLADPALRKDAWEHLLPLRHAYS